MKPQKSQTEHVFQREEIVRGGGGPDTYKHERGRPRARGGAVSIEQWVHMAGQRGCRVVGANDLSGCLLPAVGHSDSEVWLLGELLSLTGIKEVTQSQSHDFACRCCHHFVKRHSCWQQQQLSHSYQLELHDLQNVFINAGPGARGGGQGWHRPLYEI